MAGFTFEGETSSISAPQQSYISQVFEKRGYKDNKIRIESVGKPGDNYVANVKRIFIEKDGEDIFRMIAKVAPDNEFARASGVPLWFRNESVIYGDIFPMFKELQNSEDIDENDKLRVPECYGIIAEEPNELILLEDLQPFNFAILDKVNPLTNESVRIILKKFAYYHSLSFVLKHKNNERFESYRTKLVDLLTNMNKMPGFDQYLGTVLNNSKAVVNDNDYGRVFDVITNQWPELLGKLAKVEATSKYSVVIHGDAWINNMMFQLENHKPVDCIPIDFQQSKVGSPVADILHIIFTSTDHGTRHQHYYEWIDYYHSELERSLSHYGLKVNLIYPKDQYDADLRRYSKAYFVVGYLMFALMFINPEAAIMIKELQEKSTGQDMSKLFENAESIFSAIDVVALRSRLIGLVDSFREFGYIDV